MTISLKSNLDGSASLQRNGSDVIQFDTSGNTNLVATPPQFDNSQKLATTAYVQRTLGSFSADYAVYGNTTLTATNAGQVIAGGAGSAFSVTLPLASTCPGGTLIAFFNSGTGTMTVQRQGSDVLDGLSGLNSVTLGFKDTIYFESIGTSTWRAIGGSVQLGYAGAFGSSLSANGYQKLPSGVIIQWLLDGGPAAAVSGTTSFPIAFPNSVYSISLTQAIGVVGNSAPYVTGTSLANYSWNRNGSVSSSFYTIAIGR